ncbi:MAG: MazG family protein [Cellulomonadaceae bacterium]
MRPTSTDPQHGSALTDVVVTMDRLYSPGGCPWDREQTHDSLVRYLLEESYELAEAIETGDRAGMREELGDVLLQVVFHARIAAEDPEDPFTIDDVAADLVTKLVRRHPHVFAGTELAGGVHEQWEAIKAVEKARTSVLDGVPAAMGALSYAQKVLGRAERAGYEVRTDAPEMPQAPASLQDSEAQIGAELLALVRRAARAGVDAEGALRAVTRDVVATVRDEEAQKVRSADTWSEE